MSAIVSRSRLCAACVRRLRISSSTASASSSRLAAPSAALRSFSSRPTSSSTSNVRGIPCRPARAFTTSNISRAKKTLIDNASEKYINMEDFPRERIRNLSIIAHIDHGKSTLADRLLQMTGTVPASSNPQFLDKLKVERERGITVKAQTVSIIHTHPKDGQQYLINLIDTPGHVDFSYEVSRSIGACEGGLILVDCTQGIQAQTLSVFHVALEADLKLLAVINKVDLPHASPEETSTQIESVLGLEKEDHMYISAKSGLGVETVLNSIVESLPPPKQWEEGDDKLRALVFDTHYDHYRGVVSLIRIHSGEVRVGDKIRFLQADRKYEVLEIGINNPEETPVDVLREGQVGYLICSMKNSEEAHIGDTICLERDQVEPLPGFKPMKAMVYAGVFPMDSADFNRLEEAMERLTLNDRSVTVARESSAALSQGFRLGFLGTLHMDVFKQRLEDEYSSNVIITAPTVPYKVIYANGKEVFISNPTEFPDLADNKTRSRSIEEPMVAATIIVPNEYIGQMMDLCSSYRGTQLDYRVMETSGRSMLKYSFPLSEIVTDFFSALKSASSGFASFDYEDAGYEKSDMVKMNILLNGKPVDALAMIVHRSAAAKIGKEWVKKLKEVVPRQLFELAIQAAIGGKIVARESLQANRKDVTAGLYGGHYERKLKQLNKQKAGKKRLKMLAGNIEVPQAAFFNVLSSRPRNFSTSARQSASPRRFFGTMTAASSSRSFAPWPFPPPSTIPTASGDASDGLVAPSLGADLPRLPLFAGRSPHRPVLKAQPSPRERSRYLSELQRASSSRATRIGSAEVYDTYTSTYFSSPSGQPMTADELLGVARQLDTISLRNQRGEKPQQAAENIDEVLRHAKRSAQVEFRSVAGLVLRNMRRREYTLKELTLRKMERLMEDMIHDALHSDSRGLDACRADIDYFLHILAGSRLGRARFENWWTRLERLRSSDAQVEDAPAWTPSTSSYLARFRATSARRPADVPALITEALERVDDDFRPLLHAAIQHYATRDRWDVVSAIYRRLTSQGADLPAPLDRIADIPFAIPQRRELEASRGTYTTMIRSLCAAGHLVPTLMILQDMLQAGHAAHLQEYNALFRGFAAWCVAAPINGSAWSLFPGPEDMRNHHHSRTGRSLSRTSAADHRGDLTRIWATGVGAGPLASRYDEPPHVAASLADQGHGIYEGDMWGSNSGWHGAEARQMGAGGEGETEAESGPWTYDLLRTFFVSFLALKPDQRGIWASSQAPSPEDVYFILLAFSRASGGNEEVVWDAWTRIRAKFVGPRGGGLEMERVYDVEGGAGEVEKWMGWKMSGRLERVVGGLERRMKEKEEGLGFGI